LKEAHLICSVCQKLYPIYQPIWQCTCGGLLDVELDVSFPIGKIRKRQPSMWRYLEALPVTNPDYIISFSEGFTPLISMQFADKKIAIKQDHLFPSGSYKDRGASVLISVVKEMGIDHVVEDSSGNAGCAIAAYCAKAQIKCDIYVPANTSPAKLAQISQYGANLHLVPGSREDTAQAVLDAAQSTYYASHSWNPFFFQGTKTFAYEIWEQLDGQIPEGIILPAGNGTLLLGAWIGFKDLLHAGLIDQVPKIFAVQSENCAPLYQAFSQHQTNISKIQTSPTLAEGIAIAEPIRSKQILQAVHETNGAFLVVNEDEIQVALMSMHRQGFYIEPTAAATIAGIYKAIQTDQQINQWVSVFTGNGLKSTEKILAIKAHMGL
jgi:threonine synthase